MSTGETATSLAVVTLGASVYTSFMPPFSRVLSTERTPEGEALIRQTEIYCGAVVLTLGVALGFIVKSKVPPAMAVLTVVGMTGVYEMSMRKVLS